MAQAGYTPIQLYYSTTTTNQPTAGNLVDGELAINIPDGKLFYKDGGTVKLLASNASSTGTVQSVSVVSANGFAGTVATSTTTPAITLTTTITGILKGNGTAISAAVSGTDYAPATSGTSILYGDGSGGFSNVTVGTGLSFSTGTLSNSGVTSFTSSSGLSTNTSATGAVSVTNTAPMTYPTGSGIAVVSSGTSWGTTLTAPSGAIVGTTDTQTLTNKRITARSLAAASATGTVTPDSDLYDQVNYLLTGTVAFAVPSGTPTNGQKLSIRLYAASTQTVSWTTTAGGYRVIGTTLPLSVASTKTVYVGCVWNSTDSFWDVVAVATEA
jgi:hypothetical protein